MGPGRAEARVKPLICGFMSYYDLAFHSLASGRATIERHDLNLSARGLWQGPGLKGDRSTALKELTRRRRHHTLAAMDPKETPLMNAAIADYLRAFNFNGASRNFDCTRNIRSVFCATTPAFARPGFVTTAVGEQDRCAQVFGPSTI